MASVILTKSDIVESLIVIVHILRPSLRVSKQPLLKLLLHLVLLFPCKHGLILINHIVVLSVSVIHPVTNGNGL